MKRLLELLPSAAQQYAVAQHKFIPPKTHESSTCDRAFVVEETGRDIKNPINDWRTRQEKDARYFAEVTVLTVAVQLSGRFGNPTRSLRMIPELTFHTLVE